MVQAIKNLFKSDEKQTEQIKYYLIFMDTTPSVHFIEKNKLNDIYEIIIASKLQVGTYKIIKGVILND